jgi:hypothetical protein
MNTLSVTARLIAAAAAVAITLDAARHRVRHRRTTAQHLIAKLERADHRVATTIAVALAATAGGKITK